MELLKRPLADYLADRFGDEAELIEYQRFPRGSSRITSFVTYRPAPGAPEEKLVFRGDLPGGSTIPTPLDQEYFIYDTLGRTAVPVAPVLFWEARPEWTDRPFYVRRQIEGSWEIPHFMDLDPQYDELRIAISKEHLRKLGIVHNLDWKALGFEKYLSAPASVESAAVHFIDGLVRSIDEYKMEALPLVTEAADVLKAQAPVAPRLSLCKGTNGLGEEVFRDGEIVAMSDWEEASIGDPAADFASLQNFIPEIERDGRKLWGLEQALDYYRETSGIDVTAENVQFYVKTRFLGQVGYGHKAATVTQKGLADIRQVWTGTEVQHLGKRLIANQIGLVTDMDPNWFAELNLTVE